MTVDEAMTSVGSSVMPETPSQTLAPSPSTIGTILAAARSEHVAAHDVRARSGVDRSEQVAIGFSTGLIGFPHPRGERVSADAERLLEALGRSGSAAVEGHGEIGGHNSHGCYLRRTTVAHGWANIVHLSK